MHILSRLHVSIIETRHTGLQSHRLAQDSDVIACIGVIRAFLVF